MAVVRRRVLLVAPFVPTRESRHGGARVIHGLASALAECHEIGLVYVQGDTALDRELASRCAVVEAVAVPRDGPWARRLRGAAGLARGRSLWAASLDIPALTRRVAALAEQWRPDVVQIEFGVLGAVLRGIKEGPLRVVTIHDPAELRFESLPMRREGLALAHRLDAHTAVREQQRVLCAVDAAVVFTDSDRKVVALTTPPWLEVATIAPGWDVPAQPLNPLGSGPPSILFVGGFGHPPNVDAALRLARVVLPIIRCERPDVRLELVGSSPPPEVRALASDWVNVAADVPSVTPYLDQASVVVAPLTIGGGLRVKVLEAMAAGKAVVGSSRAADGLSARPGREIIVADGEAETARAVLALLHDVATREAVAQAARAWAERELAWSTMAGRYGDLYARLER